MSGQKTLPPRLDIRELCLSYQQGSSELPVLDNISLTLNAGSFMVILGPNGCGKSSLLRIIAGMVKPTAGRVLENGVPIVGPGPSRVLMFQRPTLLPWKSVSNNIAFGLRARGDDRFSVERRVEECLELVGLEPFGNSRVWELSGGMQQRVELARALAVEPDLLLLDEPFASLDSLSRDLFQEELLRIRESTSMTLIMVTHDVREAIFLGDEVLILSRRPGQVKQVVTPGVGTRDRADWRRQGDYAKLCMSTLGVLRGECNSEARSSRKRR